MKPRGYGIENIDEFVMCDRCQRWIAEISLPNHANDCPAQPKANNKEEDPDAPIRVMMRPVFSRLLPTKNEIEALNTAIRAPYCDENSKSKSPLVSQNSLKRFAPKK
jgi:hypothetical protein